MLHKLRANIAPFILLLISIVICVLNYTPQTFLSGWDTLHPEFNFGLAFERTVFGVFRIEQGLGAVAGHSHMADLPRILILYLTHFVLPLSFLRYFYIFLCMISGTLGMYFFLEKHLIKRKSASFLGSLFYLLNIATIQSFNVPFEMFTTLFATLPFVFYFATSYLLEQKHKTKNLILFSIAVIFTSPSAYAATLWYIFFACFLIYFFTLAFVHKTKDKHYLRHFLILALVFLFLNLFWLIPNLYFIANHAQEVAKANINRLFSDQAFLKNKEFGNPNDILLLKSFYFDWSIYGGNGHFIDLLSVWIKHLNDFKTIIVAYIFGGFFILGAIFSYKKLGKKAIPLFAVLIFSLFFLINDNFPISPIYRFFQAHIPFFKEALRFPDDKILNTYSFLVSIFFSFAALFIIEKIEGYKKNINLKAIFVLAITLLIFFYSLPSFSGNFINPKMRVSIPNSYFNLFDYLKTQPDTLRVANLPIQSPWGWVYYNWGKNIPSYQGAGFLYFGIKQPLMDRDFDRWSPFNESYFREMSYAIYSGNSNLLANVLQKYKIGIVLIDKNVTDPQNPQSILFYKESKSLLEKTGLIKNAKNFDNIELYTLKTNTQIVNSINSAVNVNPSTTTTYEDFAYNIFKSYITSPTSSGLINTFFPFRDLIDNQSKLHSNILNIDNEKITLNPLQKVSNFQTTNLSKDLSLLPSDVILQKNGSDITVSFYPNAPVFGNTPSISPIKGSINVGNSNRKLTLAINQNSIFSLTQLTEKTPFALGKVFLQNGQNSVSFFDNEIVSPIPNTSDVIVPFFSACDSSANAPRASITNKSMKLTGKGSLCLLIPYGFFPSKEANKEILTNFQFNFSGNAKISSCLFSQETSTCLYYKDPQRNGNLTSFTYDIKESESEKRALKIFFETDSKAENNYVLSNFFSSYQASIANVVISNSDIQNLFQKTNGISFDKIYLSKNIIYDPGFEITKVNKFSSDCTNSLNKAKKEIIDVNGVKAIKYSASAGSFCDHFSYKDLPHNQGYLIVINSKNDSGLPLTLCVTNYTTRRCDIYSELTTNKKFANDIFLLPPMDKDGIGYDINIENLGVNESPSVNIVSSLEFIPIPYQFLENIQTKSEKTSKFTGKIVKVAKYNPLLYLVETNGQNQIISLDLSFENGFKAYQLNCSSQISCFFKSNLAWIFGKEIKTHVLVDNWANGWILNGNQRQIVIVFIPQSFEFLGFLVIIFIFLVLTLHHKNK